MTTQYYIYIFKTWDVHIPVLDTLQPVSKPPSGGTWQYQHVNTICVDQPHTGYVKKLWKACTNKTHHFFARNYQHPLCELSRLQQHATKHFYIYTFLMSSFIFHAQWISCHVAPLTVNTQKNNQGKIQMFTFLSHITSHISLIITVTYRDLQDITTVDRHRYITNWWS
jgi:hypothetical protein